MPNIELHDMNRDAANKLHREILKLLEGYEYEVTILSFPPICENGKPYLSIHVAKDKPSTEIVERLAPEMVISIFTEESKTDEINISKGAYEELGKFTPK